jgi:serine/tyrosine/threonine adenylyltransferase
MDLHLDHRFLRDLPADPEQGHHSRPVVGAAYSHVTPTPVPAPRLVALADEVAELLGLDPEVARSPEWVEVWAGNRLLPGMRPYAVSYGGHQFGHWAGQLGDGRAITLGEVVGPHGPLEVQLKGAGPTPYSRRADGRAVLRSSVREFLCSEAMHHLGVPTTRALALVETGEPILRDMFYDGNAAHEPGAIVVRVAPSFLRFGNYQLFAARQETGLLASLVDHTLRHHFPHLVVGDPGPQAIAAMLGEVAERTAAMIVHWHRVGFVHGVMNTDNLSILGLTIDYGPYGWLEGYDPDWTPNTTDAGQGRYRFGHQPLVGAWNLARLAEALYPLVGEAPPLEEALARYAATLQPAMLEMRLRKLGLGAPRPGDEALLKEHEAVLRVVETDWTLFHRALAKVDPAAPDDAALIAPLAAAWYAEPDAEGRAQIAAWVRSWLHRAEADEPDAGRRRAAMDAVNPKYVLRNWLAQLAIDRAAQGDPGGVVELLEVLRRPYDEQAGNERFAARRPEWARSRPGCSMLSCSS